MRVRIIDAFTDRPGMGNPAGVVFLDKDWASEWMQFFARQVGVSETAFVQMTKEGTFYTRFFTPLQEVAICGHATVASLFEFANTRASAMQSTPIRLLQQTKAGRLAVEIHRPLGSSGPVVWMQLDRPRFTDCQRDIEELLLPLGLARADVDWELPLQIAQGNRVFIPMRGLQQLLALQPEFPRLAHVSGKWGIRGITPYTLETSNADAAMHLRHFAPVAGVNEDPVTGTSNGYLAYLLMQAGVREATCDGRCTGEQGHALGKDGRVQVRIAPDGELWIGGTACMSGEKDIKEGVTAYASGS